MTKINNGVLLALTLWVGTALLVSHNASAQAKSPSVSIWTDAETGCQYLITPQGGITVRYSRLSGVYCRNPRMKPVRDW